MNNEWALLPMRSSNDLLSDAEALRARMDEDGYLYLQGIIDPEKILALRRRMLEVLAEVGWVRGGWLLMDAIATCPPVYEGLADFAPGYDAVQRIEELHTLAHDDALTDLMRQVVGETAWPHPLKIARIAFPANYEISTPPHQDFPNNQGTPNLTASWIPVGDCPKELGSLAILRGSHRYGVLPLERHPGPGNRQAVIPPEMLEELRWVTTDFAIGDVLLFPSLTVHAALHNATELNLRLSVDFRWQQEGEALTEGVLLPHFQRLTWEEIYEGWSSTESQYYWRDKEYDVVEFREMFRSDWETDATVDMHSEIMEMLQQGELELSQEEREQILTVGRRQDARMARRQQLLERLPDNPPPES